MKKIIVSILAILLMTIGAMAADLPLTVGGQNTSGAEIGQNLPAPKKTAHPKALIPTMNPNWQTYVYIFPGPTRNNTTRFNAFAPAKVQSWYQTGSPNGLTTNNLGLDNITQPAGAGNDTNEMTLWVGVQIISPTNDIFANHLAFTSVSSDDAHYLNTSTDLSNSNTVFSANLLGIKYQGPRRSNDMILTSGRINETGVNEIIFIGAQIPYFTYANAGDFIVVSNYVKGHDNFRVTGKWTYGAISNVYVMKSLDTVWPQVKPSISLHPTSTTATVGVNAVINLGTSVVVRHAPVVTGPYGVLFTGNAGDSRTYILSDQDIVQGYFKIESQ